MAENNVKIEEDSVDYWVYDRVNANVDFPMIKKATMKEIYGASDKPDYKLLEGIFFNEGRLENDVVIRILKEASALFSKEDNMVKIDAPITICGDVHGQYYDLLKLFEICGDPASTNFLFLGDYVDRGYFSCECVLYLYAIKLNFPDTHHMLRGNHECRHLTSYFTFLTECVTKYSKPIYEAFCDSFNELPIAALVNNQFLCVHGGLSPEIRKLDDIMKIDRHQEPPSFGPFCDILWADPIEGYGDKKTAEHFVHNSVRGCSYYFTYEACCAFLESNKLLSVVRAHEAQDTGYRMYKKAQATGFPSLITIFSAPNYLDMYNNGAAVLRYENNVLNIRQFKCAPHPYWLPNFMNVFTWSVPFVGEKVMDIIEALLRICDDELDKEGEISEEEAKAQLMTKRETVKNKIRAIGRMSRLYGAMKEESVSLINMKGLAPTDSAPVTDKESINKAVEALSSSNDLRKNFDQIKDIDRVNERLPPTQDGGSA